MNAKMLLSKNYCKILKWKKDEYTHGFSLFL